MTSRDTILKNIKNSLKNSALPGADPAAVDARLRAHAKNTVPQRSAGNQEQKTELFIAEAERVNTTTERLGGLSDVGEAVMRYLAQHNLAGRIKIAPHDMLQNVDWSKHPTLDVASGPAVDADHVGLSVAACGVAETGTLVLHSGPQSPTTLNFLPDNHMVLLPKSQITGAYEDAWAILRNIGHGMPRAINWVTGPSRSADIEQTLLLGAHGPRRLHILILNDK